MDPPEVVQEKFVRLLPNEHLHELVDFSFAHSRIIINIPTLDPPDQISISDCSPLPAPFYGPHPARSRPLPVIFGHVARVEPNKVNFISAVIK